MSGGTSEPDDRQASRSIYEDVACLRVSLKADGFAGFSPVDEWGSATIREHLVADDGVEEAFVIRTCERAEVYVYGSAVRRSLQELSDEIGLERKRMGDIIEGTSAVRHLFRVCCGLESSILGEDEIMGQVRTAYAEASAADCLGGRLDTILLKALRAGERTRSETAINEGAVSLGSVTVDRAVTEMAAHYEKPDPDDWEVVVIGAGHVAKQVARSIRARSERASIMIVNRTYDRAARLADEIDAHASAWRGLGRSIRGTTDLVIATTDAPRPILGIDHLDGYEIVVFDLANPPDVEEAAEQLDGVTTVRIDEILAAQSASERRRESAIPAVREIIESELEGLGRQLRRERVEDTLRTVYQRAHSLREREIDRAIDRLERTGEPLTDEQQDVIEEFSESLINSLLHPKTAALRQAAAADDREAVDAWIRLFDDRLDDSRPETAPTPQTE